MTPGSKIGIPFAHVFDFGLVLSLERLHRRFHSRAESASRYHRFHFQASEDLRHVLFRSASIISCVIRLPFFDDHFSSFAMDDRAGSHFIEQAALRCFSCVSVLQFGFALLCIRAGCLSSVLASSTNSSSVLERRSRRLKTLTSMTTPSVPGGTVKEASLTSAAFSPKIARKRRSSGANSVSDFGVILPTRISPGFTSAPMRMIPSSPRLISASSETFGISRVISSLPKLRIARCQLKLFDVNRSEGIFAQQFFRDDDRIFEVISIPGHEGHEDVFAQGRFPLYLSQDRRR